MKIQDISYYYRTPFYVVRNDLKKINGLFVFLPELLYDKTLAALDMRRTILTLKNYLALDGRNY